MMIHGRMYICLKVFHLYNLNLYSDQVMGELQKANGECTKTVELQKVLLVMVADL